ncbi:hypothetical protein XENOCAPTIV_023260 [Xenoophorus captivus]|uniref:Hook C-terminal domain-containing protein n=1 Tax=Xenoophorus captivus TaxID=1517983 RepID=A0ABV0QWB7_9TELE
MNLLGLDTFETCFREKLNEAHSDLRKKREVIDDLEPKADSNSKAFTKICLNSLCLFVHVLESWTRLLSMHVFFFVSVAKKIDELQEILRKKDEDMKQMEQRYKSYMEKARTECREESLEPLASLYCVQVIKTLDPKQPAPTPDIQSLKNQLTEKERKIQHLESRARQNQEEKLIITAWYNMVSMWKRVPKKTCFHFLSSFCCLTLSLILPDLPPQGMALHQQVSGERLGSPNEAKSFLAQQRQSTNARRGLIRHQPR